MKKVKKALPYFLPVLILIMILGIILSRIYQPDSTSADPDIRIDAAEAGEYIGKTAEVCGEVASADYLPHVNGKPLFLNLEHTYPDQPFTAVVWGRDRSKWDRPPEEMYDNMEICVTGTIEIHEGTPQIIIDNPRQVEIQGM